MAPIFLALFSVITMLTLLVVSANVANLMLARAVVRQRETAVRQSLGASRARIVRMLIAEGVTVSAAAWLAACAFAWAVSRLLVSTLPPSRQGLLPDVTPDWQVAAYAMALAMAATIAFTVAPAIRTWRQPVLPWLKAGEQAVASGRSRVSTALVVLQLAFSVLLLTSAGLAYRSLGMIDSGEVGFNADQLLLMTVRTGRSGNLPPDAAVNAAEREAALVALDRIRDRLREVRDVEAVSYGRRAPGPYLPVTVPVWRAGQTPRIEESTPALRRQVGPDYLRVLGLQPIAGRAIAEADGRGTTRVAVINQHLAASLFGAQSPLGQTLFLGSNREAVEVIGVAPNVFYDGPSHDPKPHFVFVAEQQVAGVPTMEPTFFVRYRGGLDAVAPPLARALAEVNPEAPIVTMNTMASRLETVTEMERLIAALLVFFAAGSLIVAALGQYAIAAFNMRRRTRDFGVRMALGASSDRIQREVVVESLTTTTIGLALGFALSVGAGLAARSVLLGVTPTDPPTYAGVTGILAVASILASYLPAWRAGRVNVVEALRQE
jgi:predicted permease